MITKALAALVLVNAAALADVVTLQPSKDNTLYESFGDPASNGAGAFLFCGNTVGGAGERRALLAFNIASAIPAGSTIRSVSLRLNISRNSGDTATGQLHRLLANWGESTSNAGSPGGQGTTPQPNDCTWLHRFYPNTFWSTPGGDFDPIPSGSTALPSAPTQGPVTWTSSDTLVQDVQSWLDAPTTNFGWLFRASTPDSIGARRFDSRESATPANRPILLIEFTPPCPCSADFDAFFIAWLAGNAAADTDCSGGTPDAGDIDIFFSQWLNGGC